MNLLDRATRLRVNSRLREKGVPAKACGSCGIVKGIEGFPRKSSSPDGKHTKCRGCFAACHADYRAANRDRIAEYKADYRAANRDRISERMADYRAANRIKNADRVQDPNASKRCRTCREDLPETRFSLDRIRADGLQADCRDCAGDAYRKACRNEHGDPESNVCHLCGSDSMTDTTAHADHLVPRSKGGSDEPYNLRWACVSCNVGRKNRGITVEQLRRIAPQFFNGKWSLCA